MSDRLERLTGYDRITVKPLTPTIGAEVAGVRVGDLDSETFGELLQAWMDWKVLVFRNQDVDVADHIAFSRHFSELEAHPFSPHLDGHPEVIVLESTPGEPWAAEIFHSDVTYRLCPPMGAVLRCRVIPPVGGDTIWADMEAALEGLDSETRALVDDRQAIHTVTKNVLNIKEKAERAEELRAEYPDQEHPIVRTHPVTGRKGLYVNESFTLRVVGLDDDASDALLRRLWRQALNPLYQVRVRWRPDTVVMWDNRCTQHYVVPDFFSSHRRMERTTLIGTEVF